MGRSRYKTQENGKTYFATSAVLNWLPVFAVPELALIVLNSLKFLHTNERISLHAYVLMENHFHLIASSSDFSGEMRKFKSFTARSIIDHVERYGPKFFLEQFRLFKKYDKIGQTYQMWQEGFHPKMIFNYKMMTQKLDYIHYNPVRRGYVDRPEHWRYSSFRNYIGKEGLIPVKPLT